MFFYAGLGVKNPQHRIIYYRMIWEKKNGKKSPFIYYFKNIPIFKEKEKEKKAGKRAGVFSGRIKTYVFQNWAQPAKVFQIVIFPPFEKFLSLVNTKNCEAK